MPPPDGKLAAVLVAIGRSGNVGVTEEKLGQARFQAKASLDCGCLNHAADLGQAHGTDEELAVLEHPEQLGILSATGVEIGSDPKEHRRGRFRTTRLVAAGRGD
jgi:hypothetical protein